MTSTSVANDPRWTRIVARDKSADGHLWYSVATTGVYCRPSCPSRLPNPRNVRLHDSLESARATGLRPCKRCHPEGPSIAVETAQANLAVAKDGAKIFFANELLDETDSSACLKGRPALNSIYL